MYLSTPSGATVTIILSGFSSLNFIAPDILAPDDIPINIPDIRYVGVTASEEFPTVNLEVDEKEYNQQGIFFENVYVKIKMSEKVDQGLRKNGCPYETR